MHPSVELPPIQNHLAQQSVHPFHSPRPRDLLPSVMAHSPPGRSSTLPPLQRRESLHKKEKPARPRKSSITHNSRKPKHEKSRSRDHSSRLSIEERKAFSAEPPGVVAAAAIAGKRWEDLIEAATSATEADSDRDLTPVSEISPGPNIDLRAPQMPQSPPSAKRTSLPPFSISHNQSYKASPLQNTLTPPPPSILTGPTPFSSVENHMSVNSSASTQSSSGHHFHISSSGLSNSSDALSPVFSSHSSAKVQIYCANCRRLSVLRDSYACTECISGFCSDCVYALSSEQHRITVRGRPCPRCGTLGPRYKAFQLDIR